MLFAFPLAAKFIVGTDIFHAAALLWVAGFGHLVAGNVELGAIAWLLVGSVPGVLIGSQVSVGVPERTLRFALAAALILSGLKLLEVPYSSVLIAVALSSGLVALAVWGLIVLWRHSRRNFREPVESGSPQASSTGQLPTPPDSERTAP